MRDRITFFGSWWQNVKEDIPEELQLTFLKGILGYAFDGTEPCFEDVLLRSNWRNIKPNIDSSNASMDGGKKGGRPTTAQAKNPPLKPPFKTPLSNPPAQPPPSMDMDREVDMEKEMDEDPPSPCSGEAPQGVAESARAKKESAKMKRPTLDEVRQYMCSCNMLMTPTDPERFFDFFSSNGWKVSGRAPMKDWKAAARNWLRRNQPKPNPNAYNCAACPPPPPPPTPQHYD